MKTLIELSVEAGTSQISLVSVANLIPNLPINFLEDGKVIADHVAKTVIASVLIKLGKMDHFKETFPLVRYATRGALKYVSIQVESTIHKTYLIPSINGQSYPEMKCEFTKLVTDHMTLCPSAYFRDANIARSAIAKASTSLDAVKVILDHAKLKIGSIGCRKTNNGTDYSLRIENILTADVLDVLKPIVDIKNEQNEDKEVGFVLTHLHEIAQFMDAIGRKAWFLQQIQLVKEYEERNHLRELYDLNDGQIPNYKEKSMVVEIELDSLLEVA